MIRYGLCTLALSCVTSGARWGTGALAPLAVGSTA